MQTHRSQSSVFAPHLDCTALLNHRTPDGIVAAKDAPLIPKAQLVWSPGIGHVPPTERPTEKAALRACLCAGDIS